MPLPTVPSKEKTKHLLKLIKPAIPLRPSKKRKESNTKMLEKFPFHEDLFSKSLRKPFTIQKLLRELLFNKSLFLKGDKNSIVTSFSRAFKNFLCSYEFKVLPNRNSTIQQFNCVRNL